MRSQRLHTAAVLLVVIMLGSAEAFAQAAALSDAEARQTDVARLQRELENLRQQYAERLAALEEPGGGWGGRAMFAFRHRRGGPAGTSPGGAAAKSPVVTRGEITKDEFEAIKKTIG